MLGKKFFQEKLQERLSWDFSLTQVLRHYSDTNKQNSSSVLLSASRCFSAFFYLRSDLHLFKIQQHIKSKKSALKGLKK